MFHVISIFLNPGKFFILEKFPSLVVILYRVLCMHRDNAQDKTPHIRALRGCHHLVCVIFGTRVDENYKQTQQQTKNLRNPPIRRWFRLFRAKTTKTRVWSPCCLISHYPAPLSLLSHPTRPPTTSPGSQL